MANSVVQGFNTTAQLKPTDAIVSGTNAAAEASHSTFGFGAGGALAAAAVVIAPQDRGQQIDAISVGAAAGNLILGLRILVLVATNAAVQLINDAENLTAAATLLGRIDTRNATTAGFGWWADANGMIPVIYARRFEAVMPTALANNAGFAICGGTLPVSSRPGGGLILKPGEGAIICCAPAFPSDGLGGVVNGPAVLNCTVTVHGGLITNDQAVQGSTAPAVSVDVNSPAGQLAVSGGRSLPRFPDDARKLAPK